MSKFLIQVASTLELNHLDFDVFIKPKLRALDLSQKDLISRLVCLNGLSLYIAQHNPNFKEIDAREIK